MKSIDKNKTIYDLYPILDKFLTDKKMYKALNNKETEGIFQLESAMFKGIISEVAPDKIEDLIVITSIG